MSTTPNTGVVELYLGETVTFSAIFETFSDVTWQVNRENVTYEKGVIDSSFEFTPSEARNHSVVLWIGDDFAIWDVIVSEPVQLTVATLYGTVFSDTSDSGTVVSKALIKIKDSLGNIVAVTKTDAAGQYSVELATGTYTVSAQYRGLKSETFLVVIDEEVKQNIWL
ncbi:MAG: carboxypeptidase regulatory-like domain-containing protein [Candidatus Aenigmarchaeota archaeon]|nr:carboxypeptidase regulatory-like domain-containing protein [Candidatus Aenigmarchaeota archaeon]MCK5332902.1 carboxypeptidase regulatory-like domain-containing protein [Candidatus Aenigmarchaeota archaeon]